MVAVAKEVEKEGEKVVKEVSEKADEVKKDVEKVETEVKASVKKTVTKAKKAVAKKISKPEKKIVLQYLGKEFDEAELTERAIAQFHSMEGAIEVKTITMYLKPEEDAAYYVINEQYTGRVDF